MAQLLLWCGDPLLAGDPVGHAAHEVGASNSARISFQKSWSEHLNGTPRQGGDLEIDYSLDRKRACTK